jgi:hypothetical protein|nr:MAG TPA: hypothetical protein [Caudoviricetes sp.]
MKEKREVHFDDCEVGMFFRIDKDCPWMHDNEWMDGFDTLTNADELKVKIIDKDADDSSVEIEFWADGQKTDITDWLYQYEDDPEDRIGNNLEFLRKNRKNNYW